MTTDQTRRLRDAIQTYQELPSADRTRSIDRVLERNDLYTRQTPKAANLITRHIRLKLLLADHYDVFANTIAPNNPNVTGDDAMRARRKIDRTYALLRENGRRARLFLGDRPEPGHTSFIERLKASSLARSQRPTPLHIPELENEP